MTRTKLQGELSAAANPARAAVLQKLFQTGKGGYGEGDCFLGLTVPAMREIALRYRALALSDIERLLQSKFHEYRLSALEILVVQFEKGSPETRKEIFNFYLKHTNGINNWDLVDASAPYIVGAHLLAARSGKILDSLAKSPNVWERRIAIVSTLTLIKAGQLDDTFRIATALLADRRDLIQKATGWALREAGKISSARLLEFLETNYSELSRTALRYAIERFPQSRRKKLLTGIFDQ